MPTNDSTTAPTSNRRAIISNVLIAAVVIAALVWAFRTLPIAEGLRTATAWVDSLGVWAPIAFIGLYIFCVVFLLPGSILTAAAGTLFGVGLGTVYVSIASTLGATLAFLIGRHFVREKVEKKIAGNQSFAALDSAVAEEGWKIVGLTRLSPLFPFTLLNYAYGVTKVRLREYFLASWIGMLPGTLLYVYIGSLGKAAAEAGSKSPAQWVMYGVGLLATIAVTIYITKIAKGALGKRIPKS